MTDRIVIPDNILDELERTVELDAERAFLITLPSTLVAELVRSYRAHLESHIETHMAEHAAGLCFPCRRMADDKDKEDE